MDMIYFYDSEVIHVIPRGRLKSLSKGKRSTGFSFNNREINLFLQQLD